MQEDNPEMTAKDVVEIVQFLDQNHIDFHIDGGWGVDFLLGEQTRTHSDLDIAVQHKDVAQIRALLEARGYKDVPRDDTRDCNFVLGDDQGHQIDIHSYTFDSAGNYVFGVEYPFDSLTGTGSVNGHPVKCISPDWMVKFHAGYKLDENDYHDVKALCQRFGIKMPLEYAEFERNDNQTMTSDALNSADKINRDRHKETGTAWNVTAAIYERDEEIDIALLRSGGNSLLPPEHRFLHDLNTWCGRALHLQCAGGTDTLSLWKMGAAEVVGVDISERMIAVARRKSAVLGAPARWFCCDILDTPQELDATADLVYTGKGALSWIMDIQAWAEVVARLLKPGGRLYVFEGHPLDWVWNMEADTYQLSSQTGSYFSQAVFTDRGWPLFSDPIQEHAHKDQFHVHERQWTLGEIMNSLVAKGMRLERFEEHPDLFWNQFPHFPADLLARLPHTFSLLMRKA